MNGIANKNGNSEVDEEMKQNEDGTFDVSSYPELDRSQTGRRTSIFKYYSFNKKGESGRFVFDKIVTYKKESLHRCQFWKIRKESHPASRCRLQHRWQHSIDDFSCACPVVEFLVS